MLRPLRLLAPALALLALSAPAADAAVPGINLGTSRVPGGLIQKADVDDAHAAGAKSIRLFIDWHLIETSDGVYETNRMNTLKGVVQHARSYGMTPVLVVFHTPGWANGGAGETTPPTTMQTYADFVGHLATHLKGSQPVFEVWNEQDEAHFWAGAPQPARYADMLKRTKAAVDAADPDATVLFGALTGNNYTFFEQAFDQGGLTPDSFDGVAVHTDTACLVKAPDWYIRNIGQELDGRINRFSFLAFREVRASMLARGADKPIWMTELGWSSYTGPCEVPGAEPGRLGGVPELLQGEYTRRAYECLANYPYVTHAQVFDLRDRGTGRINQYGLLNGSTPKPAYHAFTSVTSNPPAAGIECGDFTPPAVTEQLPAKAFTGTLPIRARATDPSGVTRFTLKADGKLIRHFSGDDIKDGAIAMEWFGAKDLTPGPHTLRIEVLDQPANLGVAEVQITKLDPATTKATVPAQIAIQSVKVRKRRATLVAQVSKSGPLALAGRVQVFWEALRPVRKKGKPTRQVWKKVHGGLTSVRIKGAGTKGRVVFRQKLKYSRYRVKVAYLGQAPYLPATSKYRSFKSR